MLVKWFSILGNPKVAHDETCAPEDAHVQLAHGSFAHEIKFHIYK